MTYSKAKQIALQRKKQIVLPSKTNRLAKQNKYYCILNKLASVKWKQNQQSYNFHVVGSKS
jgi:hypothetical protein